MSYPLLLKRLHAQVPTVKRIDYCLDLVGELTTFHEQVSEDAGRVLNGICQFLSHDDASGRRTVQDLVDSARTDEEKRFLLRFNNAAVGQDFRLSENGRRIAAFDQRISNAWQDCQGAYDILPPQFYNPIKPLSRDIAETLCKLVESTLDRQRATDALQRAISSGQSQYLDLKSAKAALQECTPGHVSFSRSRTRVTRAHPQSSSSHPSPNSSIRTPPKQTSRPRRALNRTAAASTRSPLATLNQEKQNPKNAPQAERDAAMDQPLDMASVDTPMEDSTSEHPKERKRYSNIVRSPALAADCALTVSQTPERGRNGPDHSTFIMSDTEWPDFAPLEGYGGGSLKLSNSFANYDRLPSFLPEPRPLPVSPSEWGIHGLPSAQDSHQSSLSAQHLSAPWQMTPYSLDGPSDRDPDERPKKRQCPLEAKKSEYGWRLQGEHMFTDDLLAALIESVRYSAFVVDSLEVTGKSPVPPKDARRLAAQAAPLILMPYNDANTHWTLGVFHQQLQRLDYYDSLRYEGLPGTTILSNFYKCLSNLLGTDVSEKSILVKNMGSAQQSNNFDCGLYVIESIQAIITCRQPPCQIDGDSSRRRYLQVLQDDLSLNDCLRPPVETILTSAEEVDPLDPHSDTMNYISGKVKKQEEDLAAAQKSYSSARQSMLSSHSRMLEAFESTQVHQHWCATLAPLVLEMNRIDTQVPAYLKQSIIKAQYDEAQAQLSIGNTELEVYCAEWEQMRQCQEREVQQLRSSAAKYWSWIDYRDRAQARLSTTSIDAAL
ncbi:MAG: hypothetical protein Q9166_004025 [cf. Caloplaca sp. 2 TL-2023]